MGKRDMDMMEAVGGRVRTRKTKGEHPVVSEVAQEKRLLKVVNIQPKTENQSKALDLLSKKQVVVLNGASGSGKSMLACVHAANQYLKGTFERIVLIRPYEFVGRSIGLRPGSGNEKLTPLMQSMLQHLATVFGKELDAKIAAGNIVLEAVEDVRGRSYAGCVVVVDECQNLGKAEMKALLTRINEDSQLILCGDGKQKDTNKESGIDFLLDLMQRIRKEKPDYLNEQDLQVAYNNFGSVTFTNDDIVRGGWTALMVKAFDAEGV